MKLIHAIGCALLLAFCAAPPARAQQAAATPNGTVTNTIGDYCMNAAGSAVVCPTTSAGTAAGTSATTGLGVQGLTNGVPLNTSVPIVYSACSATTITTGGTAVNVIGASTVVHGAIINNPSTATEVLVINPTGTASATPGGANLALPAGASFSVPGPETVAISANAATSGHVFTCLRW